MTAAIVSLSRSPTRARTHVLTRPIFKALNGRRVWNWNVRLKRTCLELECGNRKDQLLCLSISCWHLCALCLLTVSNTLMLDLLRVKSPTFSAENGPAFLLWSIVMRPQQRSHSPTPNQLSWNLLMSILLFFLCRCVLYSFNPKQGLMKWEDKVQLPSWQSWVISHLFQPFSALCTPFYLDLYGLLKDHPSWL